MNRQHAVSAANRFGLGARPGEIDSITDPQEWLLAQLRMPASEPALADARQPGISAPGHCPAANPARIQATRPAGAMPLARRQRQAQLHELLLRPGCRGQPDQLQGAHGAVLVEPFRRVRGQARGGAYAAPMEREAIRPHVLGRFADMLLAVETHPAMLRFLDNTRSAGADSKLASAHRRNPGGNSGSTRTWPARSSNCTRWGARRVFAGGRDRAGQGHHRMERAGAAGLQRGAPVRAFMFRANAHEGGSRVVMGKRYAEDGLAGPSWPIVHPATARHVSWKIARHLVRRAAAGGWKAMARTWLASGGDLAQVYAALIRHPAAWGESARKFKTPDDYLLSAVRAGGVLDAPARRPCTPCWTGWDNRRSPALARRLRRRGRTVERSGCALEADPECAGAGRGRTGGSARSGRYRPRHLRRHAGRRNAVRPAPGRVAA